LPTQSHQMRALLLQRSHDRGLAERKVRVFALAAAAFVMGGGAIAPSNPPPAGRVDLIPLLVTKETPQSGFEADAMKRPNGSTCISSLWDQSDGLISELRASLPNPDSLKIVETVVSPTGDTLNLAILYWTTEEDGQPWLKQAQGIVDNASCKARLTRLG
jgi:hypothetical protein